MIGVIETICISEYKDRAIIVNVCIVALD